MLPDDYGGYMIAIAPCYACKRPFAFNPDRVPSVRVDGQLEAICLDCVNRANPIRERNGLPPITPLPGAYPPDPQY